MYRKGCAFIGLSLYVISEPVRALGILNCLEHHWAQRQVSYPIIKILLKEKKCGEAATPQHRRWPDETHALSNLKLHLPQLGVTATINLNTALGLHRPQSSLSPETLFSCGIIGLEVPRKYGPLIKTVFPMNSPCTGVESHNLNEQRSPNAAPTQPPRTMASQCFAQFLLRVFQLVRFNFSPDRQWKFESRSVQFWVELLDILIGFNTIDMKSSLLEISVQSLVWIWVTFPAPTILVFYNNAKRVEDGVETGPSRAWNYMVDLASA